MQILFSIGTWWTMLQLCLNRFSTSVKAPNYHYRLALAQLQRIVKGSDIQPALWIWFKTGMTTSSEPLPGLMRVCRLCCKNEFLRRCPNARWRQRRIPESISYLQRFVPNRGLWRVSLLWLCPFVLNAGMLRQWRRSMTVCCSALNKPESY